MKKNSFKKTALIYTNISQGHNVLEQGVCPQSALSFVAFLMDMDLVPVPKSVVSNLATGCQYWPRLSCWPGKGPLLALWMFFQWTQITFVKSSRISSRAGSGPWFIASIISIIWWMSTSAQDLATNLSYVIYGFSAGNKFGFCFLHP